MNFDENLFTYECEDAEVGEKPFAFKVMQCSERDTCVKLIRMGGGIVLEGSNYTEDTICLAPTGFNYDRKREFFLGLDYVIVCCSKNSIENFTNYMLVEDYHYYESFQREYNKLRSELNAYEKRNLKDKIHSFTNKDPEESRHISPSTSKAVEEKSRDRIKVAQKNEETTSSSKALKMSDTDKDPKDSRHISPSTSKAVEEESRDRIKVAQKNNDVVLVSSSSDETESFIQVKSRKKKPMKPKFRQAYSPQECIEMLDYIMKYKCCSMVKGNALWKEMEDNKVCHGRSWQSMKEHFRRSICTSHYSGVLTQAKLMVFRDRITKHNSLSSFTESLSKSRSKMIPKQTTEKHNEEHLPTNSTSSIDRTDRHIPSTSSRIDMEDEHLPSARSRIDMEDEHLPSTRSRIDMEDEHLPSTRSRIDMEDEHLPSTRSRIVKEVKHVPSTRSMIEKEVKHLPSTRSMIEKVDKHLPSTRSRIEKEDEDLPSTRSRIDMEDEHLPSTRSMIEKVVKHLPSTRSRIEKEVKHLPSTRSRIEKEVKHLPSTSSRIQKEFKHLPSTSSRIDKEEEHLPSTSSRIDKEDKLVPTWLDAYEDDLRRVMLQVNPAADANTIDMILRRMKMKRNKNKILSKEIQCWLPRVYPAFQLATAVSWKMTDFYPGTSLMLDLILGFCSMCLTRVRYSDLDVTGSQPTHLNCPICSVDGVIRRMSLMFWMSFQLRFAKSSPSRNDLKLDVVLAADHAQYFLGCTESEYILCPALQSEIISKLECLEQKSWCDISGSLTIADNLDGDRTVFLTGVSMDQCLTQQDPCVGT